VSARLGGRAGGVTYEIRERVELLPEHAALLPPTRDLAVEKVEEEAGQGERERRPEVALVGGEEVAGGREDRHAAAGTIHDRDQVREAEVAAS
jgi:hypothetical protein